MYSMLLSYPTVSSDHEAHEYSTTNIRPPKDRKKGYDEHEICDIMEHLSDQESSHKTTTTAATTITKTTAHRQLPRPGMKILGLPKLKKPMKK